MKERTVKMVIWAICLVMPVLPTYIVTAITYQSFGIVGDIVIIFVEYFAWMYVVALFIKRLAERRQYKERKKEGLLE